MASFYDYFKENMDSLGLPAPVTLFSTAQTAVANVTIILAHIDKFGKAVTVAEVAGAATKLEKLGVVGTLSASFYAGACIGSIAVATGRSVAGGLSLADVLYSATKYHLSRPWLATLLRRSPGLYTPNGMVIKERRYAGAAK